MITAVLPPRRHRQLRRPWTKPDACKSVPRNTTHVLNDFPWVAQIVTLFRIRRVWCGRGSRNKGGCIAVVTSSWNTNNAVTCRSVGNSRLFFCDMSTSHKYIVSGLNIQYSILEFTLPYYTLFSDLCRQWQLVSVGSQPTRTKLAHSQSERLPHCGVNAMLLAGNNR